MAKYAGIKQIKDGREIRNEILNRLSPGNNRIVTTRDSAAFSEHATMYQTTSYEIIENDNLVVGSAVAGE